MTRKCDERTHLGTAKVSECFLLFLAKAPALGARPIEQTMQLRD